MNFLVLSSSRGTTFQAVIDAMQCGDLKAQCLGLICDREDRGCVEKANSAGIAVRIVEKYSNEDRETYDKRLHAAMAELGATNNELRNSGTQELTVIAALGWMYILSPWFVEQWKNRIINVHPSLLPKYPGAHAIADALAAGESETGMTIHIVDEGVDTGRIVVQKICSIDEGETEESLKVKVQALEKEWVPKVLAMIEEGEIQL